MAVFNGTLLVVKNNGTVIGHQQEATLTINQDLPDATSKDSGAWATHINGLRDWEISCNGLVDYSASSGTDELKTMITGRSSATIRFSTGTSGDSFVTGTADLSQLQETAPMEAVPTWSGTLKGKGALTTGTEA